MADYDDVVFSSISDIPLTTVRQDLRTIAFETVNALMGKKERADENRYQIVVPSELIVRGSTGSCRSAVDRGSVTPGTAQA